MSTTFCCCCCRSSSATAQTCTDRVKNGRETDGMFLLSINTLDDQASGIHVLKSVSSSTMMCDLTALSHVLPQWTVVGVARAA